jgi:dipeptidyl-peptidase-4
MKLILAAAAVSMTLMSANLAHAATLTPDRVFASPDLSGPQARGVALSPDGSSVTYLKAKADDVDVTDLWIAPVAGGAPHMLIDGRALAPDNKALSEAEKSRRERMGLRTRGVVEYHWDDQGKAILAARRASSPRRRATRSTARSRPRAASFPTCATTTSTSCRSRAARSGR